jgi:uncharacterized protein with HEPN domain
MNPVEQLERETRLWHIDHAVCMVLEFLAGRSYEEYASNELVRAAVERQLIIVGEALRRALQVDPTIAMHVSDVPQIIACRNFLVHQYPEIDAERIWHIIQVKLPILLTEVRALLAGEIPA